MYRAIYTFGFCYGAYGAGIIWSEILRDVKSRVPALSGPADRMLLLCHGLVLPCLMLLSSFSFDHEAAPSPEGDGSYASTIPTDGSSFFSWLVHVLATSFFFLGCAGCAGIFVLSILPHLQEKGMYDPRDRWWMNFFAWGIVFWTGLGAAVRALHIFHSPAFWIWPLAVVEVLLIISCNMTQVMGTFRYMCDLDRRMPVTNCMAALKFD